MAGPSTYTYSSLLPDYIRLLQVTRADETVVCSLRSILLDDCPEFYAISYCWGTESPVSTINCNGKSLLVTPHLHQGLQCIFESVGTTLVWIDAICINQVDEVEKASQVARMWMVYGKAARVLVWLGPSQDDSDTALDFMPELAQRLEKMSPRESTIAFLKSSGLPPLGDPRWDPVKHLYLRQWFRRLWIVQEAVLAKELLIMCGSSRVTWAQLCVVARGLLQSGITMGWSESEAKECRKTMEMIGNAEQARKFLQKGYVPAALLLHIARTQNTLESIDRVYGILGLLRPEARKTVHVDYSAESRTHYWRTYAQLFRSLLISEGPKMLSILSSAEQSSDLPSWCPNLAQYIGTEAIPYVGNSAGGGSAYKAIDIDMIRAGEHANEVRIPGVIADTVAESTLLTGINQWNGMPSGIIEHISRLASAELRSRRVFERTQAQFAISMQQYARTLIANHDKIARREYQPQGSLVEDYQCTFKRMQAVINGEEHKRELFETQGAYLSSLRPIFDGRSFFATKNGRIGVGPSTLRMGDFVAIIFAGYCPFILRKHPDTGFYRIMGDAYVEGLMKEEVFDLLDIQNNGYETFTIV